MLKILIGERKIFSTVNLTVKGTLMVDLTKDQKETILTVTRDRQLLGNQTQETMRNLILVCLENQKYFFSRQELLPRFLEEYCTVKIACGRQTGLTTAAVKLAHNMFEHSVFIASSTASKKYAEEIFKQIYDKALHRTHFCTPLSLEKEYGSPIEAVFVDDASMLSIATINEINSSCRRSLKANAERPFVLVLVG